MKSRYVAYKLQLVKYIIQTTHKDNKDYLDDFKIWENQILEFSKNCNFISLDIINIENGIISSYVTFKVELECEDQDSSFTEKSKFIKEDNIWYYHSGEFL